MAVNSLHWVDPPLRYAKPASMLRPGGVLAVAGCEWARPADALGESRAAYFLTLVRDRLESLRWPRLTAAFAGYLAIGRRTPGAGPVH